MGNLLLTLVLLSTLSIWQGYSLVLKAHITNPNTELRGNQPQTEEGAGFQESNNYVTKLSGNQRQPSHFKSKIKESQNDDLGHKQHDGNHGGVPVGDFQEFSEETASDKLISNLLKGDSRLFVPTRFSRMERGIESESIKYDWGPNPTFWGSTPSLTFVKYVVPEPELEDTFDPTNMPLNWQSNQIFWGKRNNWYARGKKVTKIKTEKPWIKTEPNLKDIFVFYQPGSQPQHSLLNKRNKWYPAGEKTYQDEQNAEENEQLNIDSETAFNDLLKSLRTVEKVAHESTEPQQESKFNYSRSGNFRQFFNEVMELLGLSNADNDQSRIICKASEYGTRTSKKRVMQSQLNGVINKNWQVDNFNLSDRNVALFNLLQAINSRCKSIDHLKWQAENGEILNWTKKTIPEHIREIKTLPEVFPMPRG